MVNGTVARFWRSRRFSFRSCVVAVSLTLLALHLSAEETPTKQPAPFVERPETDLLLLAVRLNAEIIHDALPAYPLDKTIVVPLGELSTLLAFGIDVDVANGHASGFFIDESRQFDLDTRRGVVTVAGRQSNYDRARVEIHQDDIYVDVSLLSKWFPVDFSVDLYTALLIVRPREPLPIQLRRQREMQVEKSLAALGYNRATLPLVRNPYSLFDGPFIDQQFRIMRTPDGDGRDAVDLLYSTAMTGDLLGMEAGLFMVGETDEPFAEFRLGLGRRSPRPELLGVLHAREFGVGEVFFPGSALVALPASGPGLLVSNFPLELQGQFDARTFEGNLPLGWQVELYRNDALIAFQQEPVDGRYQFRDIPLLFGLNIFRLVFYGPQGQQRFEVQSFNIGESLTPAGEFNYRVAANEPQAFTRRSLAELSYGVTKQLSIGATAAYVDVLDRGPRSYGLVNVRSYWSRMFAHVDAGRTNAGGTVLRGGVQTRIGGLSLAVSHAILRDYESEIFRPVYGEITGRTTLRLGGLLSAKFLPGLPVTFDLIEDSLEGGGRVDQISTSISATVLRTSITHRVDGFMFRSFRNTTAPSDSLTGSLLVSRFLRRLAIRGEYNYELKPTVRSVSLAATAETRVFRPYLVSAQLLQTLATDTTHLVLGFSRDTGRFSFGADVDFSTQGDVLMRLALAAGIQRDPRTGRWRSTAQQIATRGALAARVFLDTNANGAFDAGEKPVPGAGFFVNRNSYPAVADAHGNAFLVGLPPYRDTDVSLSPSTLEDPLWVPATPGVRFVPRPGKALQVDFPILVTGEVTGTVFVDRGSGPREASGLIVQLVDATGTVVRQERTAYDGFYDMANIVPGKYTLRVTTSNPQRGAISGATERAVTIAPTGSVLDGLDFTVAAADVRPADDRRVYAAVALVQAGLFREGLALFARFPPTDREARYYYAVALFENGRVGEAAAALRDSDPPATRAAARYRDAIEAAAKH